MLFCIGCMLSLPLLAQTDTTIQREVVVEREFQPIIQSAGKLNTPLQQVETTVEPVKLSFSEYSQPLQTSHNVKPLSASQIRFTKARERNGHLTVGGGYPLSYLDFEYKMNHKSGIQLSLYGTHDAQWGIKTLSDSKLGLNLTGTLPSVKITFRADGSNLFYTRYGRYFDGNKGLVIDRFGDMKASDKQNLWLLNTSLGVQSKFNSAVDFSASLGYSAFIMPNQVVENMVNTALWFGWKNEEHTVAANFKMMNSILNVKPSMGIHDSLYNDRHHLHIEPYYEYKADNWYVHAGVNLDVNIGKGRLMSANEDISFAPSPNVKMEYRIIPSWLVVYGSATGMFGDVSLATGVYRNIYLDARPGITSHHVAAYKPVDAAVGFKIKPADGLLLDIYGSFARLNNQVTFCAPTLNDLKTNPETHLWYFYAHYRRWKAGAELTYHYQDIIHILLSGNYYHWTMVDLDQPDYLPPVAKKVYDRPSWDAHLRVDANIDSKWSLYSDNHFSGSFNALLFDGSVERLRPTIDLNIGVQYNINRWLYCYAQLNNYLHRFNDIYYGYQSQSINGEIGLSWQF